MTGLALILVALILIAVAIAIVEMFVQVLGPAVTLSLMQRGLQEQYMNN